MMDEFGLNLNEIHKNLEAAEVLCVYFPVLRKTLLVDVRFDAQEGPFVRVVPMVDSPEERLRSLRRLRPRFPRPESLVLIPWPKYVASLEALGILQCLKARFAGLGFPGAVQECQRAFEKLVEEEHAERMAAVRGEGYHTLWERHR